jgi:hypothetical protein
VGEQHRFAARDRHSPASDCLSVQPVTVTGKIAISAFFATHEVGCSVLPPYGPHVGAVADDRGEEGTCGSTSVLSALPNFRNLPEAYRESPTVLKVPPIYAAVFASAARGSMTADFERAVLVIAGNRPSTSA